MRLSEILFHAADTGGAVTKGPGRLLDTRYYTGTDCFAGGQGVTNDGKFYYCAGTVAPLHYNGLMKIDIATGDIVCKRGRYLPPELAEQGFNHYGGCTYFEGKLYVAIEDRHRMHPCIGVFNAQTLLFTGRYRILGGDIQPNGNLPWCAADHAHRLLYTGFFDHCEHINVFDIDTLELNRRIPLDRYVEKTQGGEMYDGKIYISCHDTWKRKHIYAIDPGTGHVETVMERTAGLNLVESEGMTITDGPTGPILHQIDIVYPFGMALRRYALY